MRSNVSALLLGALFTLLTGCVNPWADHFEPLAGATLATLRDSPPIEIRRVPFERVDEALDDLEQEVIDSDVPPAEWSQDQRGARKGFLLRALQVTDEPDDVTILGRSVFRSVDPDVGPSDGELRRFAESIGATHVVWTNRFEGKRQVVTRRPVTSFGYRGGFYGYWGECRGPRRFGYTTTTYVPVVIEADEFAWLAYYLRIRP